MTEAEGKSKAHGKDGGKQLDHIRISKGANGGHVVEHHYASSAGGAYQEPEKFPFGDDDGDEMMAHVSKHMGVSAGDKGKSRKSISGLGSVA